MRPTMPAVLGVLALAACSTVKDHDAPSCHGPRRPANPNGSVLAGADVSAPVAAANRSGCGRILP